MESSRKEREVIRLGPMPLREDSEERGDYTVGDSPWRLSGLSHILGAPAWCHEQERQAPLASWRSLDLTGGLWEAWTALKRSTRVLACS